jgi:hypothetical protein
VIPVGTRLAAFPPPVIYDFRVQADFAVELGAEDESLEFPWSASGGARYYNLRRQPDLLLYLEEVRQTPELGEFLAAINSPASLLESAKCDAWASTEINPEEEIFGASRKFGSYVDLVFSVEPKRYSLPDHEQLAKWLTNLLKRTPEIPAAAEFLIRRCYFHDSEMKETHDGFYFTFYLFGYGNEDSQARLQWAIALKLVENAIGQISRARRVTY